MANINRTGRSKGRERYIEVPTYLFDSHAWSCLGTVSQAAWLALMRQYYGSNNGRIVMSSRALGVSLNCSKTTAERAITRLQTYGFVEIAKRSSFARKRLATEYRMTHLRCDVTGDPPSKAFMRLKAKTGEGQASHRFMGEPDRFISGPP